MKICISLYTPFLLNKKRGFRGHTFHGQVFTDVKHLLVNMLSRIIYEPSRGKTNNVVSEQVRHKPGCTSTEAG